jgi:two-component system nitrogen regulation response regulator GlnG/two-component system response regulator HydG
MPPSDATLTDDGVQPRATGGEYSVLGLAVCWAAHEPERAGQVLLVPGGAPRVFGRGDTTPDDPAPRAHLAWLIAGQVRHTTPLSAPKVSRCQLLLRADGPRTLRVTNVGRCRLYHRGEPVTEATAEVGDLLRLGHQLLLLCVSRRLSRDPIPPGYEDHVPGQADRHGIVGESPAIWQVRTFLAFAGPREGHVLVVGASGTGKELAVRALHSLSAGGRRELVARNAATLPDGVIDAELFGNARNYPNPGMPERPGLVGAADGSSLFLDEIAELPPGMQAHLLRVLDRGEYQRLGEATVRRSTFRLLAATNRPDGLKHDVLARFRFTKELPGLNDRREDIPLLVRHLVRGHAQRDAELARACFPDGDTSAVPRLPIATLERLVTHTYTTHVRELDALLLRELPGVPGDALGAAPAQEHGQRAPSPRDVVRPSFTREVLERALEEHGGVVDRTWRALGLSSRHALHRLLAKHGIKRATGSSSR